MYLKYSDNQKTVNYKYKRPNMYVDITCAICMLYIYRFADYVEIKIGCLRKSSVEHRCTLCV